VFSGGFVLPRVQSRNSNECLASHNIPKHFNQLIENERVTRYNFSRIFVQRKFGSHPVRRFGGDILLSLRIQHNNYFCSGLCLGPEPAVGLVLKSFRRFCVIHQSNSAIALVSRYSAAKSLILRALIQQLFFSFFFNELLFLSTQFNLKLGAHSTLEIHVINSHLTSMSVFLLLITDNCMFSF